MYVFIMFIHVLRTFMMLCTAMLWFRHQFHTVEVWGSLSGGTGVGQSGTGPDFSPSTSVFPPQYHSTSAPYWYFLHLLSNWYNLSKWQHHQIKHIQT